MPFGLLAGLGAALSWGTMDIATALASRIVGTLQVTAAVQLICAGFLVLVGLATGTTLPSDPASLGWATLLGVIGAAAYYSYFNGLRIGPISVVSGMVAAYGGLTVVLSVVFRGESLTTLQAAGAAIATVGVILTGVAFDGGFRATRFAGPGVIFAVVALVLFALMAITMDIALETADWLQVLLVSRIVIGAVALLLIPVMTRRTGLHGGPAAGRSAIPPRRVVAMLILAGALDAVGLISFAIGLSGAPTWMVGLASSFGPAVTILAAVTFLGERLKGIQWAGLVGVAAGMVAIGLP